MTSEKQNVVVGTRWLGLVEALTDVTATSRWGFGGVQAVSSVVYKTKTGCTSGIAFEDKDYVIESKVCEIYNTPTVHEDF